MIEDLQVKNLLKNHRLAGSLADCGFYELRTPSRYRERRQLEYKAQLYGCQLVVVTIQPTVFTVWAPTEDATLPAGVSV